MSEYSRSITVTVSPAEVQALMNVAGDAMLLVRLGDVADRWKEDDALTANAVANRMMRAVQREIGGNRSDYVPLAPPAGTGKSDLTADVAESIREATLQGWMGEWIGGE